MPARCPSVSIVVPWLALSLLLPACLFGQIGGLGGGRTPAVDRITSVAFAKNGEFLVGAGGTKIRIWTREPAKLVRTMTSRQEIRRIAAAPRGSLLAVSCQDGLSLWNIEAGEISKKLSSGLFSGVDAYGVAFSPDGTLLASAHNQDGPYGDTGKATATIRLWDVERGVEAAVFVQEQGTRVLALAFAPDGARFGAGIVHNSGQRLEWTELRQVSVDRSLPDQTLGRTKTAVGELAYSPDGQFLATAGRRYALATAPNSVQELALWNLSAGRRLWWAEDPHQGRFRPVFSPDGKWIAEAASVHSPSGGGNEIVIRDVDSGRIRAHRQLDTDTDWAQIAYSPDGGVLAACSGRQLVLLDTETLATRERLWPLPP